MKYFILTILLAGSLIVSAHEGEGEPERRSFSEGGFQLSAAAVKNFGLKTAALNGAGPWKVPATAVLYSGEEVNLYRVRAGSYQRVDFHFVSKSPTEIAVTSTDLKAGDEVVVVGVGFLRVAEIMATGGAPEGHGH